jgi:hypothetical protein
MTEPGEEPGIRFLIRSILCQSELCPKEEDCPDHVFRCRQCGFSSSEEMAGCPACGAGWKVIDVSHGPGCPRNVLDDAIGSQNGIVVRRCFRLLNAKALGLTITLADVTEEEFRVLELIEATRQEQMKTGTATSRIGSDDRPL